MAEIGDSELLLAPEEVNREKEVKAHEFRSEKRANSPDVRAALAVIRADPGIWDRVDPSPEVQDRLEKGIILSGELHRSGASLYANIYRDPEAAAVYDIALFRATQEESDFFKEKISEGTDYTPITVVGAGGVYGTIFSAASLKENPNNPPFGFDASPRRGGLWTVSGDLVLDKPWWRMNSRNRPEDRSRQPLPGSQGNLNSLGAEVQNLQVPDISSAQYPTNNELGRVLSHDNFISNNIVTDAELVKVRPNRDSNKKGQYVQEYEDTKTGKRFFVYTDKVIQATGLGKEDIGFPSTFSSTRTVLDEAEKDVKEGVKTPVVLTFLDLVRATTSNREIGNEFEDFGLIGKGDTSKVTREYFAGIGGIDPGTPAQLGFLKELAIYGLKGETAEELSRGERARYYLQLLEFQRERGGFFRFRSIAGRVAGVGKPKEGDGVLVYYKREDQTPEGPVVTYGTELVPRLISAAGFDDESDTIYTGLNATVIDNKVEAGRRISEAFSKVGSTLYYSGGSVRQIDILNSTMGGRVIDVVFIDQDGKAVKRLLDRENMAEEDMFVLEPDRIEIAGNPLKFEPVFDKDFDDVIPVAEKASGFDVYKIGAATNLPITEKERKFTSAYEGIPENTKSIFRFVRRTVAFARKLARETEVTSDSLSMQKYDPKVRELTFEEGEKTEIISFPVDPKADAQKLPKSIRSETLLRYLLLSGLRFVFPKDLESIDFGIKRVKKEGEADQFTIDVNPSLPNNGGWKTFEKVLSDPLFQRLLVRLTRENSSSAEIIMGINSQGLIDIRKTSARSIKLSEISEFSQKYPQLQES